MGAFAGTLRGRLKEATPCGPFSQRRDRKLEAYEEAKRLSSYSGEDLVPRDHTVIFLDWDDTLFPSTWLQMYQRCCQETGQAIRLQGDPAIRLLASEIEAFL